MHGPIISEKVNMSEYAISNLFTSFSPALFSNKNETKAGSMRFLYSRLKIAMINWSKIVPDVPMRGITYT